MKTTDKGIFMHQVLFWLKEPDNQTAREQFLANIRLFLSNCKEQICSQVGVPAMTPRNNVDNTYTFALLVTLEDVAQHDRYQKDPAHLQFIATTKELWEKVQIYDSLNV